MTTLAERAAAAAGRAPEAGQDDGLQLPQEYVDQFPAPDPMAGYEPGDDDPEMVPVHLAWLRVRKEIRAIAKGEQYNGGGTRFNFRGVDTVVNTFGPVTLKHGINVLPVRVEASYRDTTTSKGSKMRECTVTVTWQIIGPKGDDLTLQTQGEALDSADKGTAKAQSVALRVLLLTSGLTPTHDKDPDASYIERGNEAPARSADSYRDEILNPKTSQGRLQQIGYELDNLRMMGAKVVNEVGEQETLDSLGRRIYGERAGGAA
ncbi:ERF family protein [Streptomyces sp. H27-H5]|uniref:ERF family protein n=1 Tax=Streptomyces sp. H27-H5 TaxID=2996460 RepID=UPI00226F04D2|nr:ERF family protein [Streptomyces sp. H27-H5]MCY0960815.1 ERF family protein [Streptomyces sp. H27-H5]